MTYQNNPNWQADMDAAAKQAETALRELVNKPNTDARDLLAFHAKWYRSAGHKRLGRLYVQISKEFGG